MKVVHLANLLLPVDHPQAGLPNLHPGRWVLNLALAQAAHTSIEPMLLVQVPGLREDYVTEVEGVPVHYAAAPDRLRAATFFYFDAKRLSGKIRKLGPDMVHAHGTEDAYGLAAQRSGLPSVLTMQGVMSLINREVAPGLWNRRRVVEWTERRCLQRCEDVIAKSEYVAKALKEEYSHLRVHRIPNTYDPRLTGINGVEKEGNLIAFVGQFVRHKGVHLICEAVEEMREKGVGVRLVVYGDDDEHATPYEVEQKERLKAALGDGVRFEGTRPGWEVAQGVARAKALVAPSLEEMFGNQVIEALLAGTHAIVSEGTAMAENVRKFGNGTVVPQQDAGVLAESMEVALQMDDFPEAASAKENVAETCGPRVVAEAHAALYEQVLGGAQ